MLTELISYIMIVSLFIGMVIPTVFDMQKQSMWTIEKTIYEYKQ